MRVQLATVVTGGDVDGSSVPSSRDLDVKGGLDVLQIRKMDQIVSHRKLEEATRSPRYSGAQDTHVSRLQGSVRDDPGPVPGLRTVGDDLFLDVPDGLVVVGRRTEDAEVVDLQESSRVG